ncbi:probable tRNA N6-adenosine threonylcarbamoyltransferase, mitochondrial isoform X2 [Rhododendron vialii]|uniref:probable tRNA N6-adenosine threonylcarbamoyltransferase, mitochondrial isoform X2 n=1 Tax=Rhododendron vialii TaxID=182163 RepID=UPI00265F73E8|nr:probable tRNA N6-adenosine threonylcarbamoyltransferase, mitochondrial isoform X2 [Rhododendron vialii]
MVSLVPTIGSTISRLPFLPKPSIYFSFRALRTSKLPYRELTPTPSPLSSSSAVHSMSNSDSPKPIAENPSNLSDNLVILGIETSCDDTAAAVVRSNGEILSQVVSSQADLLARYGGVAPKMAEEAHAQVIDKVVQEALDKANVKELDLSAVAVTIGPGLSLCLRVGVQKARKIAGSFNLPMVGVHHMEAHALVARLTEQELQFPFMALLISGGHNLLILARDLGQYVQLGTTIDDAIGEAYDKTAKWLGLDLRRSGGPAVEELAREGDAESVKFSVPMKQHKDCNFSYAGLKTQVRLAIESRNVTEIPISSASSEDRSSRADIAASFQRVAVLHLEERCERAVEWALKIEPSIKYLVVSGGVASNQYVRARLNQVVKKKGLELVCPPPSLCTDNGVMIAWTGIEHFRVGRFDPPPPADEAEDNILDLRPRWPLGEEYAEGKSEARSLKTARIHPSLTSMIQASLQQQS